ncbi:MAG: molybdopterin-guanine dinucleotide biosynthesis protein B [Methanomicrobiaceae archaeon]|nr:molybdopterin-guanine dinucleotide biosynthesis protein B [Methanomicrobiaceae archaeon]MDD5418741.1 molybdopterin-guanine dinucleotide biosynthesis protein B [Methanomicrobiaceae archaeon]
MKIIQIVGRSKTGKTQFVSALIERLGEYGRVAAVKHLGHHIFDLERGRDTTRFYESGAAISAGVDGEKSVIIIRGEGLDEVLETLSAAGVRFAIIEGFKSRPFPKIVIGDLETGGCILRNPSVDEVVASLDRFYEYITLEELVRELKREHTGGRAGAIVTFNGIVREWTGDEHTEYIDFANEIEEKLARIRTEIESIPGIIGVRFHHRRGRLYAGEDITYLAVMAEHRQEAFTALSTAIDRLKQDVPAEETSGQGV